MKATITINKKKHNGGRPKLIIDYKVVEKLALLQCTQVEIAEFLEVSTRTLQRNREFCRIYKKGLHDGHSSLRRLQWKTAEGEYLIKKTTFIRKDGEMKEEEIFAQPNAAMLIWLGKQYLGQRDITEISGEGGGAIPVKVIVESEEAKKNYLRTVSGERT
jgi:hypothetical protein